MNKKSFIEILTDNDPEEMVNFLLYKGKVKLVNAVTFLDDMEANKTVIKKKDK